MFGRSELSFRFVYFLPFLLSVLSSSARARICLRHSLQNSAAIPGVSLDIHYEIERGRKVPGALSPLMDSAQL